MNCQNIHNLCDAYFENELSEKQKMDIEAHLENCVQCRQYLRQAQKLQETLKALETPPMRDGFIEHAFKNAERQYNSAHKHNMFRRAGVGLALAASFTFIAMFSVHMYKPKVHEVPAIMIGMDQKKDIKLVFNAKEDIDQVTISIELSGNLELAGYRNKKFISWESQLQKGQNILSLPIIATEKGNGAVIAKLSRGGKNKLLRIPVKSRQNGTTRNFLNKNKLLKTV